MALVAFSGGVDSTLLSFVAHQVLQDKMLTVIGVSPSSPKKDIQCALDFCKKFDIPYQLLETHEMENPNYNENPSNRCYFCKTELYQQINLLADKKGYHYIFDGTNFSDLKDYRPGRKAAHEQKVHSPFVEAEMTKDDIRQLSFTLGLSDADRPASPCLSSRVPYGEPITIEKLSQIDQGEEYLRTLGFKEFRLRHHDKMARIELESSELTMAMGKRDEIVAELKKLGFQYITIDLEGFRSGRMNEVIFKT